MRSRFPSLYLLAIFCTLSMLTLNGVEAALLFFLIASTLGILTYRRDVLISPVVFIIVAYALAFPLPMLFPGLYPDLWSEVSQQTLEYGMLWAVRGFGAFALGYVLVEQFGKGARKQRHWNEATYRDRIRYTVYVLTCIGWLAILAWASTTMLFGISLVFIESESVPVESGAGTLLQLLTLLSSLRYPFFLGFLILHFWRKTDKHLVLLAAGLILVSIVEIITIGSKGSIIRGVAVFMLSLALLPIKVNPKQLATGAVAIIAVYGSFAVITEYRSIMHDELSAGRDVFDYKVQAESFGGALLSSLPFSKAATERRTEVKSEVVLSRFGAGMFSFANMMKFTGRQSPHENAWESFLIPVYSIAPRALIPEKPEFFNSGRNAREYYGWAYGGISVTLLGSLYYAWGYMGIIFGMAFLGGLFAYLAKQSRLSGIYSPHWLIFLVLLMIPMLDVGQTFQAITTNLIRVAVILWLLHLSYPLVRGAMRRRMSRILNSMQRGARL
jgi:hypothetical protein